MNSKRATWFATLRRDRGLFALLAILILLIQAVQPLAASASIADGGMPVICTAMSSDDGSQPAGTLSHETCAKCIAGACGFAPMGKVVTSASAAWVGPQFLAAAPASRDRLAPPPRATSERPPAIRAPPIDI